MAVLSVLDLAPITAGSDAAQSFRNSLDLARHAERWGYRRFWLAEHHGMPGIASAATAVLIAHIAGGTSGDSRRRRRHHAAESFAAGGGGAVRNAGIDVSGPDRPRAGSCAGIRSAGCAGAASYADVGSGAISAGRAGADELFPVGARRARRCARFPARVCKVPLWILGSSLFGAQVAAALGLPYAFASHFAPAQMMDAIELYRARFRPSPQLERPYVMLGFNVFAADTEEEARLLRHERPAGLRQSAQRTSDDAAAARAGVRGCARSLRACAARPGALVFRHRLAADRAARVARLHCAHRCR